MCTYKITVDENVMERLKPTFSKETLGQLLQQYVDDLVERMTLEPTKESPIAHISEEMKAIVEERLRRLDAGETKLIPGEEVFAQIRERYGF